MHWLWKVILQNIILSSSKTFYFQCYTCSKIVYHNVEQSGHDLFQISGVPVWFWSHHIFECFTLSGYRASTMSHQTSPSLYRHPSLPLYGSITIIHLEENFGIVKLYTIRMLKSKEKTCMANEPSHVKQLSLNLCVI